MTRQIIIYIAVVTALLGLSCIEKPIQHISESNPDKEIQGTSIRKIQKSLASDDVLLKYQIQRNSKELNVLVIDKKGSQTVALVSLSNFESRVDDFYKLLQQFSLPKKVKRKEFIAKSSTFYSELILPIQELISSKSRLIILTEGKLQLLPFEVLISSRENLAYTDMDYLIKNHTITYHISEEAFLKSRRASARIAKAFLGFAPVFESPLLAARNISESPTNYRNKSIQALPYSKIEVLELSDIVESNKKMRCLTALYEKANETWLKSKLKKPHGFVHIASHSFADLNNPTQSGILCAESKEDDGVLTIREISNMNIQADLVVLSSCESGVGKLAEDNKMHGIHRSFLDAGASNVLYSLWKVNDKVSSDLMIDFYQNFLEEGEDYSKGLRDAKLKLISQKSTSSPNLWAPFVLMGR